MLPIFYINLASRPDRREFMETQLRELGLEGTRVEAVTPADISPEDIARYCNGANPSYLRKTELACTLSHERVWQVLLETKADRALVFEDDVRISSRLPRFLADMGPSDAEIIRIETDGRPTRVFPIHQTTDDGIGLRRFRSAPYGTAGYIIGRSAATKLLGHPALRHRQVDMVMSDSFAQPGMSITRVLADPALCQQLSESNPATTSIGKSDILFDVQHTYPRQHPIRFMMYRTSLVLTRGLRNAVDHFVQQRNGLERRLIPLAPEN